MATIHIQSGKSNYSKNNSKIQHIPCKVFADCDANVSKFFDENLKEDTENTLKASFRGCTLEGKKKDVPKGYVGVVLQETVRPETEKDERKFYITNKFSDITYWNWDKKPSKNDLFIKAMDWMDIAEVLHAPIEDE
ncbi:ribonuclease H2 subunit C isoform X2 [Leptinotarsa decemlineata]|uniref:ribonuclease H2 subunit C isoform X2 n=1 Tax=Leptinotarsa decemlineata TaxID=7539 RepID=UPI000C255B3A|nr:ribonuclease H2 subunit C [Leptinotarsa decemlineata]